MHTLSCVDLLDQWRRQIGWRRTRGRGPRGVGALSCLVDGEQPGAMVELGRLSFVVVYDDEFAFGRTAIRVGSYRAARVAHGVQFGGLVNGRMHKDLLLSPRPGGSHLRLDLFNAPLLDLALRLNRRIDLALRRCSSIARRQFRLPRLWAGFSQTVAEGLTGSGPEFETLCTRFGVEPGSMFGKFQRVQEGLTLCPLDWVSEQQSGPVAIFAELEGFPKVQTFGVADPATDLVGYVGATAFDFYSNHFRTLPTRDDSQSTLSEHLVCSPT